jgi:hypothetical protein
MTKQTPPPFLHNTLVNFYLVPYPLADIDELTYHTKNSRIDNMSPIVYISRHIEFILGNMVMSPNN